MLQAFSVKWGINTFQNPGMECALSFKVIAIVSFFSADCVSNKRHPVKNAADVPQFGTSAENGDFPQILIFFSSMT